MGALGLAASGNINPTREWPSLFEPVHGSANDIMGMGLANPVGCLEAGSMMLRHLGQEKAADSIVQAVNTVLGRSNKAELTRDLGGQGSTTSLGDAIIDAIGQ
jgi:tartrate dehydrogenase/decarboxylase/D-malate dehydrogenase